MINSLLKLSLSGGVISGMVFLDIVPNNSMVGGGSDKKEIEKNMSKMSSIDDIEIYEKIHGCSFVFVMDGVLNQPHKLYGVREFLEKNEDAKENKQDWENKSIKYANDGIQWCKSGTVVTIFKDSSDFRLGDPYGGWEKFDS